MNYQYVFYETDESFDYGDWSWGGTYHETALHGFEVNIDKEDRIDMSTFYAFGDYDEMNKKCKTLQELKDYIIEHLDEVQELDGQKISNIEIFEEFITLIDDDLKEVA